MTVKLLTEHHLEFLHLKRGCTGSSESTHVKMPHCWKSHVMAQFSSSSVVQWLLNMHLLIKNQVLVLEKNVYSSASYL